MALFQSKQSVDLIDLICSQQELSVAPNMLIVLIVSYVTQAPMRHSREHYWRCEAVILEVGNSRA